MPLVPALAFVKAKCSAHAGGRWLWIVLDSERVFRAVLGTRWHIRARICAIAVTDRTRRGRIDSRSGPPRRNPVI